MKWNGKWVIISSGKCGTRLEQIEEEKLQHSGSRPVTGTRSISGSPPMAVQQLIHGAAQPHSSHSQSHHPFIRHTHPPPTTEYPQAHPATSAAARRPKTANKHT